MPDANEDATKPLLDHLSAQYRLYREEVRLYLGFVSASASFFAILLALEMNAAKDDPSLLVLFPLTTVSYGALLGFVYTYAQIAAKYSALLEKKLNSLLGVSVYNFESRFVGPSAKRGDRLPFAVLMALTAAMPLALTIYGIWRVAGVSKGSHVPALFWASIAWTAIGLSAVVWAIRKFASKNEEMNCAMLNEWNEKLKSLRGAQP